MIYIIGVMHDVQCLKEGNEKAIYFREQLLDICTQYEIDVIIEEYNNESKVNSHCSDVTAVSVAEQLCIEHEYCEPETVERNNLGIKGDGYFIERQIRGHFFDDVIDEHQLQCEHEKDFDLRENYWLEIIEEHDTSNQAILFICGKNHIDNMCIKFENSNIEYIIIN